ncbi:kinase-like domain-containing protein [Aspergillus affinis]|uniref:kinase-like domain-containing protein n=1 Tax=Aspergillus affinis TaxID=1070780 RepID=UPI0022FE8217|nr:kinase-like domain-containing protein [Aspergillus affinis]KAI9036249.1 kinase-like domain-containing protein [Aspergillus affinis]
MTRPSIRAFQFLWRPQNIKTRSLRLNSTMTQNPRIEYNWIKGVETLEEYRPGGYHPIMIGDLLHNRYRIADELGSGGYSTVWLARDTQLNQYVALKVNVSDSQPRETRVLKGLSASISSSIHPGRSSVPILRDEFHVEGPNGTHTCYTMTPAQSNLRQISFSRLFPLDVARALAYGVTQAVAYTHSQGYVHGDIHLSNVLVKLPSTFDGLSIEQLYKQYGDPETITVSRCDGEPLPTNVPTRVVVPLFLGKYAEKFVLSDAQPLLSDFGEAFSPATEIRLGQDCHTPPAFRAPEAKFEPQVPLTYASDIWSLATAIWEIIGMKAIFSTEYVPSDEIIAQHVDVLGPMPSDWWHRWEERSVFFDEHGCTTESYKENQWPSLEESFEVCVQKWRRKVGGEVAAAEKDAFLELMRQMLLFRPGERPTAEEVLQSEWMVKWAKADYDRR